MLNNADKWYKTLTQTLNGIAAGWNNSGDFQTILLPMLPIYWQKRSKMSMSSLKTIVLTKHCHNYYVMLH